VAVIVLLFTVTVPALRMPLPRPPLKVEFETVTELELVFRRMPPDPPLLSRKVQPSTVRGPVLEIAPPLPVP
jgi:hypothetical protein